MATPQVSAQSASRDDEQCTGVFIRLFKSLEQRGLFIAHDPIDSPCLYVVFHPILVRELSEFTILHNGHRIRNQQSAEFSGHSPNYFYDAIGPDTPARQDTDLNASFSLDSAASACEIADWRSDVDPPRTWDPRLQHIIDDMFSPGELGTLPLCLGEKAYLALRAAYQSRLAMRT